MAAPVYADTSFLVSLYVQDANSGRAVTAVEQGTTPIFSHRWSVMSCRMRYAWLCFAGTLHRGNARQRGTKLSAIWRRACCTNHRWIGRKR